MLPEELGDNEMLTLFKADRVDVVEAEEITERELVEVTNEEAVTKLAVPVKDNDEVRVKTVPVATGEDEDDRVAREADTDGEVDDDCVEDSEGVTDKVRVETPVFDCAIEP